MAETKDDDKEISTEEFGGFIAAMKDDPNSKQFQHWIEHTVVVCLTGQVRDEFTKQGDRVMQAIVTDTTKSDGKLNGIIIALDKRETQQKFQELMEKHRDLFNNGIENYSGPPVQIELTAYSRQHGPDDLCSESNFYLLVRDFMTEPEILSELNNDTMQTDQPKHTLSRSQQINGQRCCFFQEKKLKPHYLDLTGGVSHRTGEGGMDGTSTTIFAHRFLELLDTYGILQDSITEIGGGAGILAIHLAMFRPGLQVFTIENILQRFYAAMKNLDRLRRFDYELFKTAKVYFVHGNADKLKVLHTDTVFSFNIDFTAQVINSIFNILCAEGCYVKYVIVFKGDLEEYSQNRPTKWKLFVDEKTNLRVTFKLPMMGSTEKYTGYIYVNISITSSISQPEPDVLFLESSVLLNDHEARKKGVHDHVMRYLGENDDNAVPASDDEEVENQGNGIDEHEHASSHTSGDMTEVTCNNVNCNVSW